MQKIKIINVPVTNLRNSRSPLQRKSYTKDNDQESQLLYNERVKVIEENKGWVYVEAQEQPHKKNKGYRGWVKSCDLCSSEKLVDHDVFVTSSWARVCGNKDVDVSFGTGFKKLQELGDITEILFPDGTRGSIATSSLSRDEVCLHARKFLGSPYLWGGRSAFDPLHEEVTGVDCSGFITLLYRVNGINLPRNAVDQWAQCQSVAFDELTEGDLVFSSSKGGEENIDHVMLYCGDGTIIEAAMGVGKVHETRLEEKRKQFFKDDFFYGRVGKFYRDFSATEGDEVINIMNSGG
ncbi:MAG: NlpC/P60 family protein [Chlamydiota bacterium]